MVKKALRDSTVRSKDRTYRPPVFQPHFFEKGVYKPFRIPILPGDERLRAMLATGIGAPGSTVWFRKGRHIYTFEVAGDGKHLILSGFLDPDTPSASPRGNGMPLNQVFTFIRDSQPSLASPTSAIDFVYHNLDPKSGSVSLMGGLVVAKISDAGDFFRDDPEEEAIADFFLRWMKRTSLENFMEVVCESGTGVMTCLRQMSAEHPECTFEDLTRYLSWESERVSLEKQVWIRVALATGVALPKTRREPVVTNVLGLHIPSDPVALLTHCVRSYPAHTRITFPVSPRTLQTKRFLQVLLKEAVPTGFFRFGQRPETWISLETGAVTGPARAQARCRYVQIKGSLAELLGPPKEDWALEARRLKNIDAFVRSIRLKDGFFEGQQLRITVISLRELEKNGTGGAIVSPLLRGDGAFLAHLQARLPFLEVLRHYRGRPRTFLSLSTVEVDYSGETRRRICFVVSDADQPRRDDQPSLWYSPGTSIPAHYRVYPIKADQALALAGLLNHPAFCPLVFEQIRLLEEPFSPITAGRLLVPAPEAFSFPVLERITRAQKQIQEAWETGRPVSTIFPALDPKEREHTENGSSEWGFSGDPVLFAPIVRATWQDSVHAHSKWLAQIRGKGKILRIARRGTVSLRMGLSGLIIEAGGTRQLLDPEAAGPLVLWAVQRGIRTILLPEASQCGALLRFLSSLWETGISFLPENIAKAQFARFYRNHVLVYSETTKE